MEFPPSNSSRPSPLDPSSGIKELSASQSDSTVSPPNAKQLDAAATNGKKFNPWRGIALIVVGVIGLVGSIAIMCKYPELVSEEFVEFAGMAFSAIVTGGLILYKRDNSIDPVKSIGIVLPFFYTSTKFGRCSHFFD